jgi:cell division septation protein DedD
MASDDGFREIQLNGKQLVFLFMATTIVAVVIFLCGVMVGRGVRNNTATVATDAATAPAPTGDLAAVPDVQAGARGAAPPASTTPPPPVEDAGAEGRGDGGKTSPPVATTTAATATPGPAAQKAAAPGARTPQPPPTTTPAPAPAALPASGIPAEPAGNGFALQVAALNEKDQAEAIARRLLDKGYAAYIVAPPTTGGMFRVRVGKFKERREADAVVRRLKKEEQLEPWIIPPAR